MSGYTDDAVARRGLLDGEAAFIQKPFSPDALLAKVREILDATPA
jgi:DNA-binding response OmpR family regulator